MRAEVLACLGRGGNIITANARAARALRRSFFAYQRQQHRNAWQVPTIYDWNAWQQQLWRGHLLVAQNPPLLLTALQERAVWKRIVRQQNAEVEDSALHPAAALAASSYALLGAFEQHGERRRSWKRSGTPDQETFRNWANRFDRECDRNNWLSRSHLTELLAGSLAQRILSPPKEILLVGFDRTTPAQEKLLAACRQSGCETIGSLSLSPQTDSLTLVSAKDLRDEIITCAWWTRGLLERNPTARIGVIVQNQDELRGELDRVFRSILIPDSLDISASGSTPYEFSLGQPASTIPLIRSALLLLRWLVSPLEEAAISWLIHSGFLAGSPSSLHAASGLDAEIRKHRKMRPAATMQWFLNSSRANSDLLNPLKHASLAALDGRIAKRLNTFAAWVDFTRESLQKAAWPGVRTLNSFEFQARQKWEGILDGIAMLGFDGSRVRFLEFVTVLDRYTGETIFAPESHDAPIQIMGALESAGQRFDAIWFLGADARQWPAPGTPDPLIPVWLQREAGMPHANMHDNWALAHSLTERIAASAPEVVFSHPKQNSEGDLRASTLLPELFGDRLKSAEAADLRANIDAVDPIRQTTETVTLEDTSAVPWPRTESGSGYETLKMQSACPFQAFATKRLGARELDAAERGLTPAERGTILHNVLAGLWSGEPGLEFKLHSREDLLNAAATGRLASMLDRHINDEFVRHEQGREATQWTEAYLSIEKSRLKVLLTQWLEQEALRRPFTIAASERKLDNVNVGGLQLKLRADRIDKLADGRRLLIDYKTGKVSPSMWRGPRPQDPQLPLYAAYGGGAFSGVLFAQLRAGDMKFDGHLTDVRQQLGDGFNSSSLTEPYSQDMQEEWAGTLLALAEQFLAGYATVDPKRYPGTCEHCPLPGLCRVAETSVAFEVDEEEDIDDPGRKFHTGGNGDRHD